jgi:hypothetical protein
LTLFVKKDQPTSHLEPKNGWVIPFEAKNRAILPFNLEGPLLEGLALHSGRSIAASLPSPLYRAGIIPGFSVSFPFI